MPTVREELESLLKIKQKPGESDTDYAARAAVKANRTSDSQWEALSVVAQKWVNDALEVQEKYAEASDEEYIKHMPTLEPAKAGGSEEAARSVTQKQPKPAKKPKDKSAAKGKSTKTPSDRRGRPPRFDLAGKIKILVDKYPRREGTSRHKAFKLLKDGMTVQQAFDAGITSYDLMRAVRDKDVAIN